MTPFFRQEIEVDRIRKVWQRLFLPKFQQFVSVFKKQLELSISIVKINDIRTLIEC